MTRAEASDRPPTRQRRADAQRSVGRITAAAAVVLRRDGPDAPLDRIAREAGTGSATLHRHFGDRRGLLLAVFKATIDQLAADATRMRDERGEDDPLWRWLDQVVRHCAGDAALAAALRAETAEPPEEASWSPLAEAGAPLLADAIARGTANPDLEIGQLLVLVDAIATSCPLQPEQASRTLGIVRAGAGRGRQSTSC